jgi:hypothetical protein
MDSATVKAMDSATVEAMDSATVECRPYSWGNNAKVDVTGNAVLLDRRGDVLLIVTAQDSRTEAPACPSTESA